MNEEFSHYTNPAQVTDARYDSLALEAAREIMTLTRSGEFDDYLRAKIQARIIAALTAAIDAGGQAVADDPVSFQWRTIDGWVECNASGSQQRRREYALSMAQQIGLGYRELYALSQPHPADERVVEALEHHIQSNPDDLEAHIDLAALSAKEGR